MEVCDYMDEFVGASKFSQYLPMGLPVEPVEGLLKIQKDRMYGGVLFAGLLLDLTQFQCHVYRASTWFEVR